MKRCLKFVPLHLLILVINSPTSRSDHCCQSHHWSDHDDTGPTPTDQTLSPSHKLEGIQESAIHPDDTSPRKQKRYILYEINPGEGFNLRRDIFVRIAPLIKALNNDDQFEWILVLPPWRNLPHWRHTLPEINFLWAQFFSLQAIREYIPALEMDQFLDEHGMDDGLGVILNLAHFPFPPDGESSNPSWEEEVRLEKDCVTKSLSFSFKYNDAAKNFQGTIWGHPLTTRRIECVSLRGTASTLLPFVKREGLNSIAIMLNNAEVILWDNYGGEEWWRARAALKFAPDLLEIAKTYVNSIYSKPHQNDRDVGVSGTSDSAEGRNLIPYIGVHLRRRDFLLRKGSDGRPPPSIKDIGLQILGICKKLGISSVFVSTDADDDEKTELEKLLKMHNNDQQSPTINLWILPCNRALKPDDSINPNWKSEGECAIIDQLLASWSSYFIGTQGSTFTLRIFEERLLQGKDVDSTYNYICSNSNEVSSPCPKPTRWLIPASVKHLIWDADIFLIK